ncbi:MAG: polyprenyl synthetase family protein [SAR324 cluster bacterium]|nr:polyprenyl synthetase family protein [SAR324 cluster bacterium]
MSKSPTVENASLETLAGIAQFVENELDQSKKAIQSNLEIYVPFLQEVIEYINTTSKSPLRSITLALSARLFSYSGEMLPHVSSVLEYLNTATALHQKIVMTEEFRRQQKEMLSIWGNEASVLLGDYLLSISFKTMTRLGNFPLLEIIAQATQSIARGQVLSISPFSWDSAESHALEVIQNKKASLYKAAAKSGAVLGGADPEVQQALSQYGLNLGVGIQLKKDLAIVNDPHLFLSSLKIGHTLFPLCRLMEEMQLQNQQDALKQILDRDEISEHDLQKISSFFKQYQIFDYTRFQVNQYLQKSREALVPLKEMDPSILHKLAQLALEME